MTIFVSIVSLNLLKFEACLSLNGDFTGGGYRLDFER